jgi:hypothetical protein
MVAQRLALCLALSSTLHSDMQGGVAFRKFSVTVFDFIPVAILVYIFRSTQLRVVSG